jgi:hypothetical protein
MYGTPPKYRNPKLIPVSPELDAWLTGKEYIKAEPVPPLGSTVVIVGVTFKLAEVKSGELIWKATHGDLDLEFKSRVGESHASHPGVPSRGLSWHRGDRLSDPFSDLQWRTSHAGQWSKRRARSVHRWCRLGLRLMTRRQWNVKNTKLLLLRKNPLPLRRLPLRPPLQAFARTAPDEAAASQ